MQALVGLLAEEDEEVVLACWRGLEAVTSTVPKEDQAGLVRCIKEAVQTARERERRKRKSGPLRVAGFCLPPKALAPVLPIYVQGVMQVGGYTCCRVLLLPLAPAATSHCFDSLGECIPRHAPRHAEPVAALSVTVFSEHTLNCDCRTFALLTVCSGYHFHKSP
jgi:hypothetical protein